MKIDLALLKKLVTELEAQVEEANTKKAAGGDNHTYLIDLAKAAGISMSISTEATMLITDMTRVANQANNPKADPISSLMAALGGGPSGPDRPGSN